MSAAVPTACLIVAVTVPRRATGCLSDSGAFQSSGSQYRDTMFDATYHILGVSDDVDADVVQYRLCAPTYKDHHTNRQASRTADVSALARFQVEMHINTAQLRLGKSAKKKQDIAVIHGSIRRCAS
jgi:hypothetical protein